jgi:hypothetical protein
MVAPKFMSPPRTLTDTVVTLLVATSLLAYTAYVRPAVLQGLHLAYTTTTTKFHTQRDRLSEKGNQWDGLSEKGDIKETKGAPNSMHTTTCKHTPTYM